MNTVVISGLGVRSCAGTDLDAFWASLVSGVGVFTPARAMPDAGVLVGELDADVDVVDLPMAARGACDRSALLAIAAARSAMAHAGLVVGRDIAADRVAVILGNGGGGLTSLDEQYARLHEGKRPHPFSVPRAMGSSSASWVSIACGTQGPCFVTSSACASASHAVGIAFQMIRAGLVDVAITGGTEAPLSRGTLLAWQAMKIMSQTTCRPFAVDRDGLIVSEGAGVLILESAPHAAARGRRGLVSVAGFGCSADAGDIVAPSSEGMARAMAAAMADAGLAPPDVAYVNAHGTGTRANDRTEARAMSLFFGDGRIPAVSSTKGVTGHALGAAGALEAVASVLAMQRSIAPPTANLAHPDPDLDFDAIPLVPRPMAIPVAMSNSFAFGGLNASLVFGRGP